MRRTLIGSFLLLIVLAVSWPGPVLSQSAPATCPQIVRFALDRTGDACDGVGQNQACYGHVLVDAVPRIGVEGFEFETVGDTAPLVDVEALRLSAMDLEFGTWGVALISLQAYLQYAAPQDVTFLLFGDVEIADATEPVASIPVVVRATEFVNGRISPFPDAGVLEALVPGQTLTAKGRTADNAWLRVVLPVTGRLGWVDAQFLRTESDVSQLAIADGATPYYGPMQAFYFRSGDEDAYCPESPDSGLLIQTPEGVAEVTLLVNEVNIEMQATAFLQAQPGGEMTVGVLDGWAEVEVAGRRQPVFAGTQVTVPVNDSLEAAGDVSEPAPYDIASLHGLPLASLKKTVGLAAPLSDAELAVRMADWYDSQLVMYGTVGQIVYAEDGTPMVISADGTLVTLDEAETSTEVVSGPPGLDGILPPGMGELPPGQGGTPPGQAKKEQ